MSALYPLQKREKRSGGFSFLVMPKLIIQKAEKVFVAGLYS